MCNMFIKIQRLDKCQKQISFFPKVQQRHRPAVEANRPQGARGVQEDRQVEHSLREDNQVEFIKSVEKMTILKDEKIGQN